MERGVDKVAVFVDEGFAAALDGSHHDVGADAAVDILIDILTVLNVKEIIIII